MLTEAAVLPELSCNATSCSFAGLASGPLQQGSSYEAFADVDTSVYTLTVVFMVSTVVMEIWFLLLWIFR